MKALPPSRFAGLYAILLGIHLLMPLSQAAITGQWDFDNGDLSATIGQDMTYLDGSNGETASGTEFGTTGSFGIPGISTAAPPVVISGIALSADTLSVELSWEGGSAPYTIQGTSDLLSGSWADVGTSDQPTLTVALDNNMQFFRITSSGGGATGDAKVMKFPKISPENYDGGYNVPHGALANGGGGYVNQYTIIMDVLFPDGSSGARRALVQTDSQDSPNADFLINQSNGIGSASFAGFIRPNTWHRIAFAVDQSADIVSKYIDGVKVADENLSDGTDGRWALESFFWLFNDDDGETQEGYINSLQFIDEKVPDGRIALLGEPKVEGILSGPPPNPYILEASPSAATARIPGRSNVGPQPEIRILISDGESGLVESSVQLSFGEVQANGSVNLAPVNASVSKADGITTISYTPPQPLNALTVYEVGLSFQDDANPASNLGTRYRFAVGDFAGIDTTIAADLSAAGDRGFRVRSVQAPEETLLPQSISRAIQQLNETLTDPAQSSQVLDDEAIAGPNADGSYSIDTIDFEQTGTIVGNFESDELFPGIPGNGGHTTQFTTDIITFLDLKAGFHRFGGQVWIERTDVAGGADDDGFTVFVGANPKDIIDADVIHTYERSLDAPAFASTTDDNQFNFVAPTDGLYPFRFVYHQKTRGASLEWYSIVGEEKILINGSDARAIKAYQTSSAAHHNRAYVAEVHPSVGAQGVSASEPIEILLLDDRTQVDVESVKLFLNDVEVTAQSRIEKSNGRTTVFFQPNATRPSEINALKLVYSDGGGDPMERNWEFTSKVTAGSATVATGLWNFRGGLQADIGQALEYFGGDDSPAALNTEFSSTTELGISDINGVPADVMVVPYIRSNELGYVMHHGISPNGGGTKVNQYTLIYDVMIASSGDGAAGMIQIDSLTNSNDGDYFWQGGNFGQGGGGYVGKGTFTAGEWHRIAFAVDLAADPPIVTKYADGIKQDDWEQQSLDQNRRALKEFAILFADNGDEHRMWYVNSVQIRDGKLSDAQLAWLGGPSADGIPADIPNISVTGQWDFNDGLSATVGQDLEYFGGDASPAGENTEFSTTTELGISDINGEPAEVMVVPYIRSNELGYIMHHGISPNGGGTKVNQYTLIYDVMIASDGDGAAGMIQIDSLTNSNDGDYFWQRGNFGQGGGGYEGKGTFTAGEWHRIAFAVDLAADPPMVTKYADGIKQDDWVQQSLDQDRRALKEFAILFADNGDEHRMWYVNSVQIREGKLSDAQLAWLGGPSASGIPLAIPETTVTGQWDFNDGLSATAGRDLEYFGGDASPAGENTQFSTTTELGISDINGEPANVMVVPYIRSNELGYVMHHGILPNGGGTKVNQYTLIYDVMIAPSGDGAAGMIQIDSLTNSNDGDYFWQGGNFGQGGGGYEGKGTFTAGEWHRIAFAVDLAADPPMVTKYADGIKQDDWVQQSLDQDRRALKEFAILFADNGDEHRMWYVNSVQIREGKLSDAQLAWLGGPSAAGIPIYVPQSTVTGQWDFSDGLSATAGLDLEYFGGDASPAGENTEFSTTTELGISDINGEPATVMVVPYIRSNELGYIMHHGISPNGGGSKVNQYTLIYDVMIASSGDGAAGMIQIDSLTNSNDGDYFWQGGNFGQGGGGYNGLGTFTAGEWHRIAFAVDLAANPPMATKFADGIKQDDWVQQSLDQDRRALKEFAILFADNGDEHRMWYVNSVQIREGKLSDGDLIKLGGPQASGIPITIP